MRRGRIEKEGRRKEAQERDADRAKRTNAEQIKLLEAHGHGECKEATRLRERIAKGKK